MGRGEQFPSPPGREKESGPSTRPVYRQHVMSGGAFFLPVGGCTGRVQAHVSHFYMETSEAWTQMRWRVETLLSEAGLVPRKIKT